MDTKSKRRLKSRHRHELRRKERRRIEKAKHRIHSLFGIVMLDTKLQIDRKVGLAPTVLEGNIFTRLRDRIIRFIKEKFFNKSHKVKEQSNVSKINLTNSKKFTPGKIVFKDYQRRKI